MRLLIVIVNYRTGALVVDCLRSLASQIQIDGGARVVVTDNASPDDSVAFLRAAIEQNSWASWVKIVPLDRNGGFAFGNNGAIAPALRGDDPPDCFLLLNPDTIVLPGALSILLDFMAAHPDTGIAGPRLELPGGAVQTSACRFHTIWSELENGLRFGPVSRLLSRRIVAPPAPAHETAVDWVSGACLLARREVFERVGLMDEGYFMYYEEVDFCLRAKKAGYRCWYVPESRVVHLIGQSSGTWDPSQPPKRRPAYWFASRRRFFRNHYGAIRAMIADILWAGGYATYRLRRVIQRKPDTDPDRLLGDFVRYNFLPMRRTS